MGKGEDLPKKIKDGVNARQRAFGNIPPFIAGKIPGKFNLQGFRLPGMTHGIDRLSQQAIESRGYKEVKAIDRSKFS